MARPTIFASDLKVNFRLRDFFLDFLACLVPGLIFLITASVLVVGLIASLSYESWSHFTWASTGFKNVSDTINSFVVSFWASFAIIFLSYFAGHILYRQTPKRPDYASFLRIRDKVISIKDDWVIKRGMGAASRDVQFPYENLGKYLRERGFNELSEIVPWYQKKSAGVDEAQRSKTFINRMKVRISLYYPEHTLNIIRNEAHIRLASSMWYAALYIIKLSYGCSYFLIFCLIWLMLKGTGNGEGLIILYSKFPKIVPYLPICLSFICLSWGIWMSYFATKKIKLLNKGDKDSRLLRGYFWEAFINIKNWLKKEKKTKGISEKERRASENAKKIYYGFRSFAWSPVISCSILLMSNFFLLIYLKEPGNQGSSNVILIKNITWYLIVQIFLLIGTLFGKHRIEETFHYQRVREIIYVLETASLTKLLDSKKLPKLVQKDAIENCPYWKNQNLAPQPNT